MLHIEINPTFVLMTPSKIYRIILLLILTIIVGRVTLLLTLRSKIGWYERIVRPDFVLSEDGVITGWTISLVTLALATGMITGQISTQRVKVQRIVLNFTLFMAIFFSRPIVFLYLQSTFMGMINILLLFALSIAIYLDYTKINEKTALLVLPSALWLVYISAIGITIWLINLPL